MTELEWITVEHMDKEIDIKQIIINDHGNQEGELCIFLTQAYYTHIIEENAGKGAKLNREGQERALSLAKWQTTRRVSSESDGLAGLVERAKFFMLNDAENTGWHHSLEYDDVSDLLASILEGKEGMNEAYDWRFIVEQLVPAAQQAKIPASMISMATQNVKKVRGLVPAARELLQRHERGEIEPEEAERTLQEWIKETVDDNVSYEGLREKLDHWRGVAVQRDEPFIGYKILMPNGKFMLAIPTRNDRDVAIVEQSLRNKVDIRITGMDWLEKRISND
jgi:hypothetical protein